jgi:uncharacterized protein YjaZ
MKITILAAYEQLSDYVRELKRGSADIDALWEKYAIEPYWDRLCRWAQVDLTDRKPEPVRDVVKLKAQLALLEQLDLSLLESRFMAAIEALPPDSDDEMYVAIYPAPDDDAVLKEQLNGVVGACFWGSMVIRVNPLAADYEAWLPYVFAHEYHHNISGAYWYVEHAGELGGMLIEALLSDGQADAFALSVCPKLAPKWIGSVSPGEEAALWERYYKPYLTSAEFDYPACMFGSKELGIPWCAGYTFGYKIIESFRRKYPEVTFRQLYETPPHEIYLKSGYRE